MATSNERHALPHHTILGQYSLPPAPIVAHRSPFGVSTTSDGIAAPLNAVGTSPPHPVFYIMRPNGLPVPLVPADELPEGVHLRGAPRGLRWDHVQDMQYIGTFSPPNFTYQLEDMSTANGSVHLPPTHYKNPSTFSHAHGIDSVNSTSAHHDTLHRGNMISSRIEASDGDKVGVPNQWRRIIKGTERSASDPQDIVNAILPSHARSATAKESVLPASGKLPDQDKKEYCTYWIRTGECDYMQQGCLYKHEMPDKTTLAQIGFRCTPQWWLERNSTIKPFPRKTGEPTKSSTVARKITEYSRPVRKLSHSTWTSGDSTYSDEDERMPTTKSRSVSASIDFRTDLAGGVNGPKGRQSNHSFRPPQKETDMAPYHIVTSLPNHESAPSKMHCRDSVAYKVETADLIDFKPLSPTLSPSSTAATTASSSRAPTPTSSSSSESAPDGGKSRKEGTKKKMVFVPKGESTRYHLAAAATASKAKYAAKETANLKFNVATNQPRSGHSRREVHRPQKPEIQTRTTTHAAAMLAPDGLMASKYAPSASKSSSNHINPVRPQTIHLKNSRNLNFREVRLDSTRTQ